MVQNSGVARMLSQGHSERVHYTRQKSQKFILQRLRISSPLERDNVRCSLPVYHCPLEMYVNGDYKIGVHLQAPGSTRATEHHSWWRQCGGEFKVTPLFAVEYRTNGTRHCCTRECWQEIPYALWSTHLPCATCLTVSGLYKVPIDLRSTSHSVCCTPCSTGRAYRPTRG